MVRQIVVLKNESIPDYYLISVIEEDRIDDMLYTHNSNEWIPTSYEVYKTYNYFKNKDKFRSPHLRNGNAINIKKSVFDSLTFEE